MVIMMKDGGDNHGQTQRRIGRLVVAVIGLVIIITALCNDFWGIGPSSLATEKTVTTKHVRCDKEIQLSTNGSGNSSSRPQHDQRSTLLLYMVSTHDDFQRDKIKEMQQSLGPENVAVVWDNVEQPKCPFEFVSTCIDNETISETRYLNNKCCGLEKAITWAMQHTHTFDYVWFMEDDVHYRNVTEFRQVVQSNYSTADLLHQQAIDMFRHANDGPWFWAPLVRCQADGLFGMTQIRFSMFNFYRISARMLQILQRVYYQNDQEWIFFEALFPTVAVHYGLSTAQWVRNDNSNMKYRPCYKNETIPNLGSPVFHPAKNRNGTWQDCSHPNLGLRRKQLVEACYKKRNWTWIGNL